MNILKSELFDSFENDNKSFVFEIIPNCFNDNRGYFMESFKICELKDDIDNIPSWYKGNEWIKQINRSSSSAGVIRGCHSQKGKFCQGKMVEAINERIYDIITDVRPNSKTFGVSSVFVLDPLKHNKLWVPRGFLHAFAVPFSSTTNAIFEYVCDNVYDKSSEIRVNPSSLIPNVFEKYVQMTNDEISRKDISEFLENKSNNIFSEQDKNTIGISTFMEDILKQYEINGKLWYN